MDTDKNVHKAYFASECFQGTEYRFMKAVGVKTTAVGFMVGNVDNPSYMQVKTEETGHLECIEVEYDTRKTKSYKSVNICKVRSWKDTTFP